MVCLLNLELRTQMEEKMVDETLIKFIVHRIERFAIDNPKTVLRKTKVSIEVIEAIILEELKKDEIQENHTK